MTNERLKGHTEMTEESRCRCLLAIGILSSLTAYLLFVSANSVAGLTCSALIACAGLGASFRGLRRWHVYQGREYATPVESENDRPQ